MDFLGQSTVAVDPIKMFRKFNMSRDMTNQQNDCAPIEDSDQPGYPLSLIRVFAVRWMGG